MSDLNQFIEEELKKRKVDYLSSHDYLLEHYYNERENIEAYNGRQLLEMLQNADDACENASNKMVLIKLKGNKLIIANNGEPFTKDGFSSIIYISRSPKIMQPSKIGNKGLGFRSILSWAEEVIIDSGGIKLGFSETIAKTFLEKLMKESPEVANFIKQKSKIKFPIATLRIPKILSSAKDPPKDFDTSISIKLKANILDDVQSQILTVINKETLIFLNHVETIEIDSPERKITYKKRYNNKNKTNVTIDSINSFTNAIESKSWNIKKRGGRHKGKVYELAIAWNDELNDTENVLFSYFKTKVRFPFPALLHGTFELTPNRNQLDNDTKGHNKFLIGQLVDLLIESSLSITKKNTEVNYSALKLLNIDFEKLDSILLEFKFKDILQTKIRESKLFPTVNGKYVSYSPIPAFYIYPVASILSGRRVHNLLKYSSDNIVIKIIESFAMCHYTLESYLGLISEYKNDCAHLSKLIFHLLTFTSYTDEYSSQEFELYKFAPFLIDNETEIISWDANIFIQPKDEKEFKLPKSINIRFISSELINLLLQEFRKTNVDFLIEKLEPFKVKKYSFTEITEILIYHYKEKENTTTNNIRELHYYLFGLFKREIKEIMLLPLVEGIEIPVISINGKIKNSTEIYFGIDYGSELTEKLYSFDKTKLLAPINEFNLENETVELIKKYFIWLGVADFPRYSLVDLTNASVEYNEYKEHVLRNYDYRKPNDYGELFRDYNHLQSELVRVPKITVGYFDELKKILTKAKLEVIFEWIKKDDRLRKTLEENSETHSNSQAVLDIRGKKFYRHFKKSNLRSFTRWLFATTVWMPIESESKKAAPDKCCLSKTITQEFSPFVEKPKIEVATFSDRLELSEEAIESYLVYIGVHREIGSFSISALYEMLASLPTSDKEGKAARKLYREIISNFNENKIDIYHPTYKSFVSSGKMFCQKGSEIGYFPVNEAYYIPTKAYGNNILKLFPLSMIDSKQGPQKIEKLFGVKRLKDISFSIAGEPLISPFNDEFQKEIERFKGLVYVLRMYKDIKDDIANKLKRLRIILSQELQTKFTHNGLTRNFELDPFEYIPHKKRNQFYITVPSNLSSLNELRESNKFCQSISEIFSTIIETEEYSDFIHDLFSKPEFNREARLLNYIQKEDNADVITAKNHLNIIDDIRLSFWRAFSISSSKNIWTEIRNEKELNAFLEKKLKLNLERIEIITLSEGFYQLNELSTQEFIYELFVEFDIDYKSFVRHFSGVDFASYFKNKFEDLKISHRNEFSFHLFNNLKGRTTNEKEKYFDFIDGYNLLGFDPESAFSKNIEIDFINLIKNNFSIKLEGKPNDFSIEGKINETITTLMAKDIIIPSLLKEKKSIQAYLLFNEEEEVKRQIDAFNLALNNSLKNPSRNKIKLRGIIVDYEDYNSLAEIVLTGLDINRMKYKTAKTLAVEDEVKSRKKKSRKSKTRNLRFNTKNEEQIGFIAELICYHKLIAKYGVENINWISENANRAYPDKFITSEAGKGYDLELMENQKVRFVEIKGTSNIKEGVYISKEEMKTALEFPDRYDLLIVENPLGSEPNIKHIKSPFKFKKEESLFSNDKLKVFNDNYIIKFKWNE